MIIFSSMMMWIACVEDMHELIGAQHLRVCHNLDFIEQIRRIKTCMKGVLFFMLHPSHTDLINAVNSGRSQKIEPVVQSRYSIVIATAKRARQLIGGEEPMIGVLWQKKPLSVAVEELYEQRVKILSEEGSIPKEEE